jgi:excisionase family DNA binding protein
VTPPEGREGGRGKRSGVPRASRADTARRAKGRRQLVGLSAAAAYADVSTRTLRRYIAQGRLTGYRVGPRLVKADLSELDQLARPPTPRLAVPGDRGMDVADGGGASGTQLARKRSAPAKPGLTCTTTGGRYWD